MGGIVIALSKPEDAKRISDIFVRRGIAPTVVCTNASNVISQMHRLESGVVICGQYIFGTYYTQLSDSMPDYFEMLLLASAEVLERERSLDVMSLTVPFKAGDLVNTVSMMLTQIERRIKKQKSMPKKRSWQEQNYINNAKYMLMERNNMTEQEAFRYIQKCSMDSGTNMVETAQMILLMLYG